MMNFILEHPILTYFLIGSVFGVWHYYSMTPEKLRLVSKELNEMADEAEEMNSKIPRGHELFSIAIIFTWAAMVLDAGVDILRSIFFKEDEGEGHE
jgi:hypothetical protein